MPVLKEFDSFLGFHDLCISWSHWVVFVLFLLIYLDIIGGDNGFLIDYLGIWTRMMISLLMMILDL